MLHELDLTCMKEEGKDDGNNDNFVELSFQNYEGMQTNLENCGSLHKITDNSISEDGKTEKFTEVKLESIQIELKWEECNNLSLSNTLGNSNHVHTFDDIDDATWSATPSISFP